MVSINKMKVGQEVFNTQRCRAGNTTIFKTVVFSIKIVEINLLKNQVFASWNSNPPRWYCKREFSKWKLKKPVINSLDLQLKKAKDVFMRMAVKSPKQF